MKVTYRSDPQVSVDRHFNQTISSSRLSRWNLQVVVYSFDSVDPFREFFGPGFLLRGLHHSSELYDSLGGIDVDSREISHTFGRERPLHGRRHRSVMHGF